MPESLPSPEDPRAGLEHADGAPQGWSWHRRGVLSSLALALSGTAVSAQAQAYPSRPVKLVVAYAAGGANDLVARHLARGFEEMLGQPFVVENRPGAAGIIGTEAVARAPADGYSLLLGAGGAITINPSLYPNLPYDPLNDFAPIGTAATSPLVLVVNPSLPVHSATELVRYIQSKPEGVTFGSAGIGTPLHLAGELFKRTAGVAMTHVPYRGTSPALTDLVGGKIDLMFDTLGTSLPHIRAGRLRALAVTSPERSQLAPEIPTLREQGVRDADVTVWYGLFAPKQIPGEILNRLSATLSKMVGSADLRDKFAALALEPMVSSPEQFSALIRTELSRWSRIVQEAGVRVE
ncbi:Bug family tripartite tricarboxylate transporter substrate binding protein [Roseomonas chloroacetimidivorans]|uniref:Bug family tripartite tricarboxylate transporter substrate binding protein n=1 Tax=Roseomonas chloroacetimidivorans TaxID=1766656 RepID=UPI003C789956